MLKFKKIEIRNFLSYGNAPITINLDTVGTTLIVGEDLDNTASGTGANGVGKSVWLNALIYGLFGKPLSNISMDNLVNNVNKKNMRVDVEFQKDDLLITVRRARKEKGAGNYAKVFVRPVGTELNEDEHDKTPDNISNINDFVVEYLGIPFELFVRIVAFAATHAPFLDLPLRQQSDMMEELFRLTRLSFKAERLKAIIKDTKQSMEIKIKHNEQLEKEHERHTKQLETAQKRVDDWEEDRKDDLKTVQTALDEYKDFSISEQEDIYTRLTKLNDELVAVKEGQKEIEDSIKDIGTQITVVTAEQKVIERERKKVIEWKDNQLKKIAKEKKFGESLVEAHILSEQKKFIEELAEIDKEVAAFIEKKENTIKINDENRAELTKAEKELEHLEDAKCPYCLQDFAGAKNKADECVKTIAACKQKEIDGEQLLDLIKNNLKTVEDVQTEIYNKISYTLEEINEQERLREETAKKIEELLNEKNPHTEASSSELTDMSIEHKKTEEKLRESLSTEADRLIVADMNVELLDEKIRDCKSKITVSSLEELYEIKSKISKYKEKIEDLKNNINPYIEPLDELKAVKLEAVDMDSVNKLDNLITHQNYMLKLLTKKDSFIRKKLINRNLDFLNQRLHVYLSALGLPHKVEFTHEMTAKITQFGRELDFGNLSSGQKARVNLGLSFSFRDILQKSHEEINVCMLDEVLDVGLDAVGVQNAARLLKRKAWDENLSLFIISHRDEVSNIFDRRMTVQLEHGFSSVKIEE